MKKVIPILLWTLAAFTTISCSSDSSTPTTEKIKERTVLSSYVVKETFKNGMNVYTVNFTYDKDNKVEKHVLKYESIEGNISKKVSTTTYNYTYNNNKQLVSVQKVNDQDRKSTVLVFEYDHKQQMTKFSDKTDSYEVTFLHNEKKQINEALTPSSSVQRKTHFRYDNEGNLAGVSTNNNPNVSESYTYDSYKNPFRNIPINIQLDLNRTMATDIIYYYAPVNNISTYKLGLREEGNIQYEYNSDNYPTSSKKTLDDSVITETFVYKKIKE